MSGTPASADDRAPYGFAQLDDLDDAAQAGGFGETMEARFADEALGSEQLGVSLQRVRPGMRLHFAHRHLRDEEIYVVLAGSGRALAETCTVALKPRDALRIAPGTGHSFEADDQGLELLVVRARHGEDDSEFADLRWPTPTPAHPRR